MVDIERLKNKRFLYGFFSVFPLGILMLIGTLGSLTYIAVIIHWSDYERRTIVVDTATCFVSRSTLTSAGSRLKNNKFIWVRLGDDDEGEKIALKIAEGEKPSIEILYNQNRNDAIWTRYQSDAELLKAQWLSAARRSTLLLPSVLCLCISYYYKRKIKKYEKAQA